MTERRGIVVRVAVDRDRCAGSGNCVFWAPGIFELDDSGLSVVIAEPLAGHEDKLAVAAEGCPTGAISVEYLDSEYLDSQAEVADKGHDADTAV